MIIDSDSIPPSFAVEVRRSGATALIGVRGELDMSTAPELSRAVDEVRAEGARQIVVDLRELEFMDSSGMYAIVRLDRLSRQDGFTTAVVKPKPAIQRLFAMVGMEDHVVFVDAPESLAPPGG